MPKYVIIGLIVVIGTFIIMNYWPKLKETTKNKIIASHTCENLNKFNNKVIHTTYLL